MKLTTIIATSGIPKNISITNTNGAMSKYELNLFMIVALP
tara:strand:+ start:2535 stop:2654 length:120 start_codon:yes stop_codon:yes gene_type:complete